MTATDELRRLLDERGVRWTGCNDEIMDNQTFCCGHSYTEFQRGIAVTDLTPEQAVEATLGRGECRLVRHGSLGNYESFACWSCSNCDFGWHHSIHDKQFSYCPNCGAKVLDEMSLEQRNADFCKAQTDAHMAYIEAERKADRLQTENDNLRELARVFYHCTTSGECEYCPINGGGTVKLMADTICDTIHDRMRELGIEVES